MLSREEIEKMASDEKYAAEKMKGVQGALRMSEQVNREFGYTSAFGKNAKMPTHGSAGLRFLSTTMALLHTVVEAGSVDELMKKIAEDLLADEAQISRICEAYAACGPEETDIFRWLDSLFDAGQR